VTARAAVVISVESGLQAGDVIHAVNRRVVASVDELRDAINRIQAGQPAVLQIERRGSLAFLAFDMD